MDDLSADDQRSNLCADVVSLTRLEPGLAHLLRQPVGTWVAVSELYRFSAEGGNEGFPCLAATWLPPPSACGGGVVIVFFDANSLWSMLAYYYAVEKVLRTGAAVENAEAL